MAAMIGVNGVLAWALIFGRLGLPALGLVGAGIATAISSAFSFFAMLALVLTLPDLRKHRILRRFHRPVWPRLTSCSASACPSG
jgi:MATE family multidrug resistance protein